MSQPTITFKPEPKQYEALKYLLDDTTSAVLFGGSGGCGKSYLGCSFLIILCLQYPGVRVLMGRAKLSILKATTLKTFYKVCSDFGLTIDKDYSFNGSSNVITFTNGSEVYLKDLFYYPADPEYTSLGGLEVAAAFIDEIAEITTQARDIVRSRLGWKLKDGTEIKPKLYMTCNPNKGFAYKEFYIPYINGTLPDHLKFIPALPKDNKHLSKGRFEELSNLTGANYERLFAGNWEYDSDPSALIGFENINNVFTNSHLLVYDVNNNVLGTRRADGSVLNQKYITWDVSGKGKDKAVIYVWKGLAVIDYTVISTDDGSLQVAAIKAYQTQYGIPNSNICFDNDGIGGLAGKDFPGAVNFNNGSSPLNKENFVNLKSQCYFKLSEIINNNELYFKAKNTADADTLRQELEQVKRKDFDKDGKLAIIPKEQVKALLKRSPDFSDCLMLRMYYLIKHRSGDFYSSYSFASF